MRQIHLQTPAPPFPISNDDAITIMVYHPYFVLICKPLCWSPTQLSGKQREVRFEIPRPRYWIQYPFEMPSTRIDWILTIQLARMRQGKHFTLRNNHNTNLRQQYPTSAWRVSSKIGVATHFRKCYILCAYMLLTDHVTYTTVFPAACYIRALPCYSRYWLCK